MFFLRNGAKSKREFIQELHLLDQILGLLFNLTICLLYTLSDKKNVGQKWRIFLEVTKWNYVRQII